MRLLSLLGIFLYRKISCQGKKEKENRDVKGTLMVVKSIESLFFYSDTHGYSI